MLTPIPSLHPRPHRRTRPAAANPAPAPPTALTLVAATYQSGVSVTLTFNQAIDVSGFDGEAVSVEDGPGATVYVATGTVTPLGTTGLRVGLDPFEEGAGYVVVLNAPATTGIVTLDGRTWGGVTNLLLPFG